MHSKLLYKFISYIKIHLKCLICYAGCSEIRKSEYHNKKIFKKVSNQSGCISCSEQ